MGILEVEVVRNGGRGRRKGLSVDFLEIFGRDAVLSLSCIVSCGLLSLEEMAAMEINDSFNVSVSSNFCVFCV